MEEGGGGEGGGGGLQEEVPLSAGEVSFVWNEFLFNVIEEKV